MVFISGVCGTRWVGGIVVCIGGVSGQSGVGLTVVYITHYSFHSPCEHQGGPLTWNLRLALHEMPSETLTVFSTPPV